MNHLSPGYDMGSFVRRLRVVFSKALVCFARWTAPKVTTTFEPYIPSVWIDDQGFYCEGPSDHQPEFVGVKEPNARTV